MDTPDPNLSLFEFSGTAVHRRGWSTPVWIRVEPPFSDYPDEYVCAVACSLIGSKTHPIRAGEPQHAYALAFRFLRFMLSDFSLRDTSGAEVPLPRIAPYEDDIRVRQTPDTGYGQHGTAINAEGEMRPFYIGVSVPESDNGYSAKVFYGSRRSPVEATRGADAADAFYNGIAWIEARLNADGLVLLDIWNMPVEVPKRPKS